MFELSVACKYLIPRRRQLSVSIISLISVLVIALVVWLIIVFFSVTDGLEKNWVKKLTALTAPVRITPTEAYYQSYYYQIDSISDASDYSLKTMKEKRETPLVDPYNSTLDQEIPSYWPSPDRQADGTIKDLVKLVYQSLDEMANVRGLRAQDFELTATHIHLNLIRPAQRLPTTRTQGHTIQSTLSYPAYLGNFDQENLHLGETLLPMEAQDFTHLLDLIPFAPVNDLEDRQDHSHLFSPTMFQKRLKAFFDLVTIQQLKTPSSGWIIPRHLLGKQGKWEAIAILKEQQITHFVVPQSKHQLATVRQTLEEQGLMILPGTATLTEGRFAFRSAQGAEHEFPPSFSLTLAGGVLFKAKLQEDSLDQAKKVKNLLFTVEIPLQGTVLQGTIPYRGLEIGAAEFKHRSPSPSPWWVYRQTQPDGSLAFILPKDEGVGEGILLPKSFQDVGVLVGDRGSLSYLSPTPSLLQEQQIPIYVAGFYDPGIIPIGGKFILADPEMTSLIRASHQQEDKTQFTQGINVHFDHLDQADLVKAQLQNAFKTKGIQRYWTVETYREYEFTKGIIQEIQSQKHLFMLISLVIIVVACSNIISMLVILVNDKKKEIGILRAMGASSRSIAFIFGLAGGMIGVFGSVIGLLAALLTLRYLHALVNLLSHWQGYDMFNTMIYGKVLPHELSFEALAFVLAATVCLSLLAGIVPAIKACLLRPSHILRTNGD